MTFFIVENIEENLNDKAYFEIFPLCCYEIILQEFYE